MKAYLGCEACLGLVVGIHTRRYQRSTREEFVGVGLTEVLSIGSTLTFGDTKK